MKLIDRIQPITQRDDYAEFVELWRAFERGQVIRGAGRMIELGILLHRYACVATALSVIDGVTPPTEAEFGETVTQVMPELAAFLDYIDRTLRPPRPPAVEA